MSSPFDPPHPVNVKTIKQHKNNESIFSYSLSPFLSKKEVDFSTSLFYYTHGKS